MISNPTARIAASVFLAVWHPPAISGQSVASGPLDPPQHRCLCRDVLEEPELSCWSYHAVQLGERSALVVDRAQHQTDHADVEAAGRKWQLPGNAGGDGDRHRGVGGRPLRQAAQVRLGLDREDRCRLRWVMTEVQPVAGTNLNNPTRDPCEQFVAYLAHPLGFHARADPDVEAGEHRTMRLARRRCHPSLPSDAHA